MIYLKNPIRMTDLAVRLAQGGDTWHAPLIRACMAGDLRLIMIPPGARMPLAPLDVTRDRRPLVVILAGDGAEPAGPGHFPQALRLFRWARFVMVHGTGGQAVHYEIAAAAAQEVGRVVIAETGGDYLKDWCAFKAVNAPRTPGLIITTRPGEPPHPMTGAPAGATVQ